MHFALVDRIQSLSSESATTLKNVSLAEEYLQDHFATFPVLPGVMMIECLVQAARLVMEQRDREMEQRDREMEHRDREAAATSTHRPALPTRWVLGKARAVKYGAFVRPGAALRIEVTLAKLNDDGSADFKAHALLLEPNLTTPSAETQLPVAASGRITLRPTRAAVFS